MKKRARRQQIARQTAVQKRQRRVREAGHVHATASSQQQQRAASLSHDLLAAKPILERFDDHAKFRNSLDRLAGKIGEWAGIPMPIRDQKLVIEPTYAQIEALRLVAPELIAERAPSLEPEQEEDIKVRNMFWSMWHNAWVYVFEQDGKVKHVVARRARHHFDLDIQTLGSSIAWGIEQESRAVTLLGTLLRHHNFKQYLMTGMFLETSKRSGVTYMFRRLKPTVALTLRGGGQNSRAKDGEHMRILCTLCMHPIGYYAGSWAGAMTPTDDIVAHLMLMRGDEHMFWKRANQHPPYRPEAGL